MNFSELGLSQPILRALTQEGYTIPTPIQRDAIPQIMLGRDVLGCAQTGTGKTAAFALPILHRLTTGPIDKSHRGPRPIRVLVLSPTRELAGQIGDSFNAYGRETGLSHTVIYGGVSQYHQERALKRGADIVVATPGRLLDLIEQRIVDLSHVEVLVLDEADRMLDMGFIDPIRRIASKTPSAKEGGRQTLLFSATMPKAILQLAHSLLRDPVRVSVDHVAAEAPKIEQGLYMVRRDSKQALLEMLLADPAVERAVVFSKTKHGAERIGRRLERAGMAVATIHGNKNQNQRQRALDRFRSTSKQRAKVLVATDVAARGLDVDGITHVFNFDLPMEAEAYVHRIGRTGRAGATGIALSFCDSDERGLLRDIERMNGRIPVRTADIPPLAPIERAPREHGDGEPTKTIHRPRPNRQPVAGGEQGEGNRSRGPRRRAAAKPGGQPARQWTKSPAKRSAKR